MTSLLKYIDPQYRTKKAERQNARTELLRFRETEAKAALGLRNGPGAAPKPGDTVGYRKTRSSELIDIFLGNIGEPPLSERTEIKNGEKVPKFRGNAGPVLRRFTRGKSKYYPAVEDRKHAKQAAGGRLQRAGRVARRLCNRILGRADQTVRPGLPGVV